LDGGTITTPPTARRLTVDGEVFEVRPKAGGGFDFDWVSGPNSGYGFSSGPVAVSVSPGQPAAATPTSDDPAWTHDTALTARIRNFLQQIDPATGYIED
jgi:hypothetical protein